MKTCKNDDCKTVVPGRALFCPDCKEARVKAQQFAAHAKYHAKVLADPDVRERRNLQNRESKAANKTVKRIKIAQERRAAPVRAVEPVTNTVIHLQHLAEMGLTVRPGEVPASEAKVLSGAEFEAVARAILQSREGGARVNTVTS